MCTQSSAPAVMPVHQQIVDFRLNIGVGNHYFLVGSQGSHVCKVKQGAAPLETTNYKLSRLLNKRLQLPTVITTDYLATAAGRYYYC
jgi:hypothetical protein